MTTNMLQKLVQEKMNKENLSLRNVGDATSISHTTISRIVQGGAVDIDTLLKICKWLDVSPSHVLDGYKTDEDNLEARIASLLDLNPNLREVFAEAMDRYEEGEVSADAIGELLAYAAFRLGYEQVDDKVDSSEEDIDLADKIDEVD